jgi:histidinol-phosphate aminotransferase
VTPVATQLLRAEALLTDGQRFMFSAPATRCTMDGITRRDLGRIVTGGVAALAWSARSGSIVAEAAPFAQEPARRAGSPVLYRLSSNENNYGLAPAAVDALKSGKSYANRYGAESVGRLTEALAKMHGVPAEHILLTPGSGEILRAVTLAFTAGDKGLIAASPTFESPVRTAKSAKAPVHEVPVLADGTHDLKAMAAAASATTGLAFVCNPNNPTGGINMGTAVREFMTAFRAAAPEAYVLVDEAYYDYVTDASYETAVPFTQTDKRILVSRTFSKIHGMAGLRVGYAIGHPETLGQVRAKTSSGTLSSVSAGAALASLEDQAHLARQKVLNAEARTYTRTQFEKAGFTVLPSEGNFVMVDVRRPSTEFQELCRDAGISVARAFPPMTTYSRITIGTVDEMKKAVALMVPLLSAPAKPNKTTPASSGRADAGLGLIEDDDYSC